jgi:hypothetical protein
MIAGFNVKKLRLTFMIAWFTQKEQRSMLMIAWFKEKKRRPMLMIAWFKEKKRRSMFMIAWFKEKKRRSMLMIAGFSEKEWRSMLMIAWFKEKKRRSMLMIAGFTVNDERFIGAPERGGHEWPPMNWNRTGHRLHIGRGCRQARWRWTSPERPARTRGFDYGDFEEVCKRADIKVVAIAQGRAVRTCDAAVSSFRRPTSAMRQAHLRLARVDDATSRPCAWVPTAPSHSHVVIDRVGWSEGWPGSGGSVPT